MASEILGLFGGKTPQQLRNDFLDSTMVSPQQMAQQGLLQQVVSMGQNAGSMIGAGAGRLFGGKVAGEVEQQTIKNIYQDIQKLDLPTESAKYKVFATKLGEAGLTQQAALAAEKAASSYSSELKDKETQLGIEDKTLSNFFHRATLLPRVQQTFVQLNQAQQALKAAEQAYAQANKTNPLEVKKAEQALATAQQNMEKTAAEMAQFNKISPSVVAEAQANATSAQTKAQNEVNATAARQIMSEFPKGSPEYNAALDNLVALTSATALQPKPINFGADREAYSSAMYEGREFKTLTPVEQANVNLALKEKSVTVARAGTYESARELAQFDAAVKDNMVSFQAAQSAKNFIREAQASNNPDSWEAARTTTARAIGKSKLSNEDIRRLGGTPEIIQAFKDITSKAFTGVPTRDTQRKLYVVNSIIERYEAEQINKQADRYRAAATGAGVPPESLNIIYPKANGATSWNDLN